MTFVDVFKQRVEKRMACAERMEKRTCKLNVAVDDVMNY
jgi:hypothetical protein